MGWIYESVRKLPPDPLGSRRCRSLPCVIVGDPEYCRSVSNDEPVLSTPPLAPGEDFFGGFGNTATQQRVGSEELPPSLVHLEVQVLVCYRRSPQPPVTLRKIVVELVTVAGAYGSPIRRS